MAAPEGSQRQSPRARMPHPMWRDPSARFGLWPPQKRDNIVHRDLRGASTMPHTYFVYILASHSRVIYTGVTRDLAGRVWRHRQRVGNSFTARYNVTTLVWYQTTDDVRSAIAREKQIKGWSRAKRVGLIETMNPDWKDLSQEEGFMNRLIYRRSP
jgi:putative endonuclease